MSVWIVDDETNLANGLKRAFERRGHSVECMASVGELYDALNCSIPSLIFLDQCLPDAAASTRCLLS